MKIALEGCDGSGKTTIAKELAKRTGFGYIHYPFYENECGQKILEMLNGKVAWDALSFQCLQTCNRILTIDYLEQMEKEHGGVIVDRYNISTFVYGQLDGLELPLLKRLVSVLPKPDMEIVIICDKPYRLSTNDFYEKMGKWTITKELYLSYAEKANLCNPNTTEDSRGCVKTVFNNASIQECIEECLALITNLKEGNIK